MKSFLRKIKKIAQYLFYPKEYCNNIELCGQYSEFLARFVVERMHITCKKGKVACFNTYSIPTVLHYHRAPIKLFFTQENTHVQWSAWQQFENVWEKEPSLALTLGFDYAEHPKYMRFPYWLEHIFGPMATRQEIADFIDIHNIADPNGKVVSR